jgi:hypothetical protein
LEKEVSEKIEKELKEYKASLSDEAKQKFS